MKTVIAVTGIMGSGKSTLLQNLSTVLPQAFALYEDDYQSMTDLSPEDLAAWWRRGGDVSEFDFSTISKVLSQFLHEAPFCHYAGPEFETQDLNGEIVSMDLLPHLSSRPLGIQKQLNEMQYVFVESQFGRYHPQLKPWIDYQIWLDIPPDRALARKLAQYANFLVKKPFSTNFVQNLEWVENFCRNYDDLVSQMIAKQRSWVVPDSDIIIRADLGPENVLNDCLDFILNCSAVRVKRPK
jgi:uridine kinase